MTEETILTPKRRDEIAALLDTERKAPYSPFLLHYQVALCNAVPELLASHAVLIEQLSDIIRENEDLVTDRDEWKALSESCDAAWSTKRQKLADLQAQLVAAEGVIQDQCYAIEAYKSERLSAAGLERDLDEAAKRENNLRTALQFYAAWWNCETGRPLIEADRGYKACVALGVRW